MRRLHAVPSGSPLFVYNYITVSPPYNGEKGNIMSRPKNPDRIPLESSISRTVNFYTLSVLMYDKEAKSAKEYVFDGCYGNAARIAREKAKTLPGKYMDYSVSDEKPELLWLTLDEYVAVAHRAPARAAQDAQDAQEAVQEAQGAQAAEAATDAATEATEATEG